MSLFRLRQYFEVCGILSDVYVARQLNSLGQVYGFVRFLNVRNREKLAQALNNVWIGDRKVWAREARFDRFAQYDVENRADVNEVRRDRTEREVRPMVITHREGVKNVRVRRLEEEAREGKGEKKILKVGTVEVNVEKKKNELKKKKEEKKREGRC
ncbi:putative nucleotide-binding alpha-beta plait domain-containing protein [Medicago truncatula]|uniref:Putative nucleotide-binding alpha-beta plait domain-containing protein n=1 Tax=Medicago truncatula TaxID=3880 RepID=A0A396HIW1_MEDTR|nr:putative nucleotide-binding alpha-beta plait domain-containing protein [Medicago truncatula]